MKKPVLAIIIVILAFPVCLFGHSPDSIMVSHEKNEEREFLKISVSHNVIIAAWHYVSSITISVNDEELEVLTFSNQETREFQNVEYEISGLSPDDVIEINASCSLFGSVTKELQIE